MGLLVYGGGMRMRVDDRALAHVHAVVAAKLRRHEPFFFSWFEDGEDQPERHSFWMSDSIGLQFRYDHEWSGPLNREWVELLMRSANSVSGLVVVPEPEVEPVGETAEEPAA